MTFKLNNTFLPSEKHEKRNWFVLDCKDQSMGRLACIIVCLLQGTKKCYYHPAIDVGDYVILINADKFIMNKEDKKFTVYKPGRPGRSLKEMKKSLTIERVVKGMLSNVEVRKYMKRLYIYNDIEHPHKAQNPIELNASHSFQFL
jgi:large subunit ribosomal protein L13